MFAHATTSIALLIPVCHALDLAHHLGFEYYRITALQRCIAVDTDSVRKTTIPVPSVSRQPENQKVTSRVIYLLTPECELQPATVTITTTSATLARHRRGLSSRRNIIWKAFLRSQFDAKVVRITSRKSSSHQRYLLPTSC